ncbi:Uncharacterized protein dnm_078920 [Desulfonema magnum]|uniref:Uncharacterized protein n=1 Tax=Desulfonema magnum TaxID=45655 RepID=A0A975BV25_9BACT|nr:Uncharacterized protein dnm_078920 [Desulfonema magnum]
MPPLQGMVGSPLNPLQSGFLISARKKPGFSRDDALAFAGKSRVYPPFTGKDIKTFAHVLINT